MLKIFKLDQLTYVSVLILAIFLFVSFSVSALHHILIIVPGVFYLYKNWKDNNLKLSYSSWALLGVVVMAILSVVFNNVPNPMRIILKLRYFLIGILLIFALEAWLKENATVKKIKWLIYLFLICATIASLSGLVAKYFGYNYLKMKPACHAERTCGMYGMYMTYAYGMQFFLIINLALILFYKKFVVKLNLPLLIIVFLINGISFYLSYARGAYVGLFVALSFFFLRKNLKIFFMMGIGLILLAAIVFFTVPQIKETFTDHSRLISNDQRTSQYKTAWRVGLENPFLGLGYRNFEPQSRELKTKWGIAYPEFQGHAHNNFLEHLASTGFIGFIFLILFHIFWFIESYKRKDSLGDCAMAFVVALTASGMVQYTLGDGENLLLIMVFYAITQMRLPINGDAYKSIKILT